MAIEKNFTEAKNLIDQSNNILLTMHERMDGDDGGALLATGSQLEKMGKNVTYAVKKGVPPSLNFLPGSETIKQFNNQIINFDHHPDNTGFGHVNVVDSKKSSVAELVYDFFLFNKWPITKDVATCLLTGIITDTGGFMHSNTQSSTLTAAGMLLRKGAQSHKIIRQAYKNKSPQILKAWGRAMENSYYDEKNKIIYSVMTEKDLTEFTSLPQAAFEGFTETLNTMPEAKFAMFLRQDGGVIKGSLRSDTFKNIDVSKIAQIFGGGGHKLAAGFSVAGKLMKDEEGKWKVI